MIRKWSGEWKRVCCWEENAFYPCCTSLIQDAGYGGKTLFAVEEDEEDESSQKIDDEVFA